MVIITIYPSGYPTIYPTKLLKSYLPTLWDFVQKKRYNKKVLRKVSSSCLYQTLHTRTFHRKNFPQTSLQTVKTSLQTVKTSLQTSTNGTNQNSVTKTTTGTNRNTVTQGFIRDLLRNPKKNNVTLLHVELYQFRTYIVFSALVNIYQLSTQSQRYPVHRKSTATKVYQ